MRRLLHTEVNDVIFGEDYVFEPLDTGDKMVSNYPKFFNASKSPEIYPFKPVTVFDFYKLVAKGFINIDYREINDGPSLKEYLEFCDDFPSVCRIKGYTITSKSGKTDIHITGIDSGYGEFDPLIVETFSQKFGKYRKSSKGFYCSTDCMMGVWEDRVNAMQRYLNDENYCF